VARDVLADAKRQALGEPVTPKLVGCKRWLDRGDVVKVGADRASRSYQKPQVEPPAGSPQCDSMAQNHSTNPILLPG
jgi:hypothetical protein